MWFRKKSKSQEYSDQELVQSFVQHGNQDSLAILFERYVELVYGVCLKYLKDVESAKDETMTIYQLVQDKLTKHSVGHFKSWLYQVVKNHCLQIIRKADRRKKDWDANASVMLALSIAENGEAEENEWRYSLMDQCLCNLSHTQKETIELFYLGGKSYEEIADQLQLNKEQVRSNLQNGRRNLKKCIQMRYANPDTIS